MTWTRWLFVVPVFLLFAFPVCADPVKVVASFSLLGDLVRQIGGDCVNVTVLVGPDGDTHTYQPTPADAKNIARADLVIINGLGFEGWIKRLIEASGYKGSLVIASDGVPRVLRGNDTDAGNVIDPHAWQNLKNGEVYVKNIAEALVKSDPIHAGSYRRQAKNLANELQKLDRWVRQHIDTVPISKRSVISSHGAFGYFSDAYGVTFIAPVGLSTDAEPSAEELKKLVEMVRSGKTHALFLENMTDTKLMAQLSRETGVRVGGKLYADALSPDNGPAATYQQMFRYNVQQLVAAMQMNQ